MKENYGGRLCLMLHLGSRKLTGSGQTSSGLLIRKTSCAPPLSLPFTSVIFVCRLYYDVAAEHKPQMSADNMAVQDGALGGRETHVAI